MGVLVGAIYPETASYSHSPALDSISQSFYPYITGATATALISANPVYSLAAMPAALNYNAYNVHSFKDDYYYRIHFLLRNIQLGNITGDTEIKQYIWNAYLEDKTLNSVSANGNDGINHVIKSLPYRFKPTEEIKNFYQLSTSGPTRINASYGFNFDNESYAVTLQGQRVVVFPYRHNYRHSKQYQFYTDVINSYNGEQRFLLRKLPRILWAFDYQLEGDRKVAQIKIMTQNWAERKYAFLDFFDERKSEDTTAAKATSITIDDVTGLQTGDNVTLWQSDSHFENVPIKNISGNRLEFEYPLELAHTKPFVVPSYFGYMQNGLSLSENKDQITAKCSFINEEVHEKANNTYPLFKGHPVIDEPSVFLSSLTTKLVKKVQTFDPINGMFITPKEAKTKAKYVATWNPQSKVELKKLEAFICYLKGKYQPFWIRSFKEDTKITERATSGANKIKIQTLNLNQYQRRQSWYVNIDGNSHYFSAVNAIKVDDEVETLELSTAITFTIPAGTPLSLLTLYRSSSDNSKLSVEPYMNSKLSMPIIEVLDE